ncbi:F-box/FBD/LRR-repeat protein At5g22700-like [Coffea eugenioides]|uniref:F-box/FBD/LRR-repeat protein At5g22700-like n=1 Tax=Coffea eugenioides TaxID=49369 RepID=UPI000F60F0CA|nr:F-box/FBD/LRR-repeat protein At5g22700-like [Coffea eugenioides]
MYGLGNCINLIRQRNGAPIRKFELTIFPPLLCDWFQLQIDSLISSVLLCNVQELEILLYENDVEGSNFLGIFTCKTLVVLKMDRRVVLDISNSVALPNLKLLHLERFSMVGKDSLDMLIQGCPLLEELHLDIVESPTNLSHELAILGIFRYKTLVSLRLSWKISLYLCNSAILPNLKVLNLTDFSLVSKDSFQRLIQGCPLLEELYLYGFDCSNHANDVLHISSRSLKKLLLYCYLRDGYTIVMELTSLQRLFYQAKGEHKVLINSPNLQVLDYVSDAVTVNFTKSPTYATRARLVVQSSYDDQTEISSLHVQAAYQLISSMQSVKWLSLSDCTLEALCYSPHPLPTFMNLTNLRLGFNECSLGPGAYHIYWWNVLPRLLKNAPNLEVFWNNVEQDKEFQSLLPVAFPVSFVEHLKEMEIKAFSMLQHNSLLVEYFLQKRRSLRKMALGALMLPSDRNRISFNKCSVDCQIVFQQLYHYPEPEFE